MGFKKAAPQQARLKVSMYGPPGAGKTFTALLFAEGLATIDGKRVAYADTERGTDFYAQAVKARQVHPAAFDFDAVYTKSLAEVISAVKELDPAVHGVVVLDSVTHLWQAAMDAYQGEMVGKDKDKIPLQAWGKIKAPYKSLMSFLIASPFHVFLLGRQKNVFEDDGHGSIQSSGVAMRAEGETQYEPHICFRMASEVLEGGAESVYHLFAEKDRTGVLAGRRFANPDFGTISPLLPLLGNVQAQAEDEDERKEKDGELLEKKVQAEAKKLVKSAELLAEFVALTQAGTTLEALGQVRDDANKKRRSMTGSDRETLRGLFQAKAQRFVEETVGEAD